MKIRNAAVIVLVTAMAGLSACSSSNGGVTPGPSQTVAPAGSIVGTVLVTDTDHPAGKPAPNVGLGIYLQEFSQVGNQYTPSPPQPVATVRTGADGGFMFQGLTPGRYFLALWGGALYTPGRWVTVGGQSGTQVQLVVCGTCPPPA